MKSQKPKIYRIVAYASGNKCFPLVVRSVVHSTSGLMSNIEISWTLEEHFDTTVDIQRKNGGPFRIIQNYSEKVLALFDIRQMRQVHRAALKKIWPKHGPTFMRKDEENIVTVQVWKDNMWITVDCRR